MDEKNTDKTVQDSQPEAISKENPVADELCQNDTSSQKPGEPSSEDKPSTEDSKESKSSGHEEVKSESDEKDKPSPEDSKESKLSREPEEPSSEDKSSPEDSKESGSEDGEVKSESEEKNNDTDDETSGEEEAEEQAPQNIQRGRLVVGVMIALLVVALVVVVTMPPLAEVTTKKVGSQFQMPPAAQVVSNPSSGQQREIAYTQVVEKETYHIEIEQKSFYNNGHRMHVSIKSDVEMVQPALKGSEYEVAITMKDMDVHVYDDDSEVILTSAGRLFSGISLYASIDPHRGMGNVVPEPNVNPQVRRVLYIIADGIRQFYPAVPEQPVGDGATYRFEGLRGAEGRLFAVSSASCHYQDDQILLDLQTSMTQDATQIGSGKTSLVLKDGKVSYGKSTSERVVSLEGVGPERQEFRMEWVRK